MYYKLYKIKSEIDNVPFDNGWWDSVEIDWKIIERDRPVISYSNAIIDYNKLDDYLKTRVENIFNEFLTEEEADALEELLLRLDFTNGIVETEEYVLPVSASKLMHDTGLTDKIKKTSVFHIHAFEKYDLPFKVIGVADYTNATPVHTVSSSNTEQ